MSTQDSAPALHVERWGSGPEIVMVHGGQPEGGSTAFAAQRPLAERWTLVLPDRPGHGQTPAAGPADFERDAALIAPLLGQRAHLVGHSYGGVVALVIAARHPQTVRSLTLVEPGVFALAPQDPEVRPMLEAMGAVMREPDPRRRVERFQAVMGNARPVPDPLPPPLERFAHDLLVMRQPNAASLPLEPIADARIPALLVSGGHNPAFERICDLVAERLGGERAVIPGHGHMPQASGEPFNARLEAFLTQAVSR